MNLYTLSGNALAQALRNEQETYTALAATGIRLDLSRGRPAPEQLDAGMPMLADRAYLAPDGTDCRNYGQPLGIPEMRALFEEIVGVPKENIVVGGNSSLQMIFDAFLRAMVFGTVHSPRPWYEETGRKFLCPVPGYDRHFRITERLGFAMPTVPMTEAGPDMDAVERLALDPAVKGIWCVPRYANPTGVTYSEETVRRLATMKTGAPDFTVVWDDAYAVHGLTATPAPLANLFLLAREAGTADRVWVFTSTSKITFAGGGVAMMGASDAYWAKNLPYITAQIIGTDKLGQLRHLHFLRDRAGVEAQMQRHRAILAPKFDSLLRTLERELGGTGIARWTTPKGGYFISLDLPSGCARRTHALARGAGLTLTEAGATYPYGVDPQDSNLRLAPSCCPTEEVPLAGRILASSARLAFLESRAGTRHALKN